MAEISVGKIDDTVFAVFDMDTFINLTALVGMGHNLMQMQAVLRGGNFTDDEIAADKIFHQFMSKLDGLEDINGNQPG